MNPPWEADIKRELAGVKDRLGLDILISSPDIRVEI
jgi:hypothetical protein